MGESNLKKALLQEAQGFFCIKKTGHVSVKKCKTIASNPRSLFKHEHYRLNLQLQQQFLIRCIEGFLLIKRR